MVVSALFDFKGISTLLILKIEKPVFKTFQRCYKKIKNIYIDIKKFQKILKIFKKYFQKISILKLFIYYKMSM